MIAAIDRRSFKNNLNKDHEYHLHLRCLNLPRRESRDLSFCLSQFNLKLLSNIEKEEFRTYLTSEDFFM